MPHDKPRFKGASQKRPTSNAVDGFVPQRRRPVNATQYYGQSAPLSGGPRRPLAKRQELGKDPSRQPTEQPQEVAETPMLDDFDRPESNPFEASFPSKVEKPSRRQRRADKKDGRSSKDTAEKKHGRLRTWWKNRSLKFKLGFISAIVILGLGGFAGIRLYDFINSVFGRSVGNSNSSALNDNVDPNSLNTEGDGRFNILLMGRGGVENEAPDLTDTMLIASVDIKNQTASLLSVPRDTWVETSNSNHKINATYSLAKQAASYRGKSDEEAEKAGVQAAIKIMREVAGVPIHKYVLTDYKAFRDVVDALGGVSVTVPEPIFDGFTGWRFKAGTQTMNGDTALKYARTRHGSARGDFDRNENQRRLLLAMREKATSTGIVANPIKVNALANAVQKNIRTDLSVDEARTLFDKTKMLPENKIASLDLAKADAPLVRTDNVSGQSVVRPTEGFDDYSKIRAYARSNMVDPFLKNEAPKITIYNATGKSGLATTIADVMASYGYKILGKETSETNQAKTLVIRMNKDSKKPYTERYLSVRFGTVIASTLPTGIIPPSAQATTTSTTAANTSTSTTTATPPKPDYIIVIGADFKTPSGPTW